MRHILALALALCVLAPGAALANARIKRQTHRIPHVTRPPKRHHHISPGACAPAAESLAEVFFMLFETKVGGKVEQAENANGGIHNHAPDITGGIVHLALQ